MKKEYMVNPNNPDDVKKVLLDWLLQDCEVPQGTECANCPLFQVCDKLCEIAEELEYGN